MGERRKGRSEAVDRLDTTPRPGEPRFVLLGRDPHAAQALEVYANLLDQALTDGIPDVTADDVANARKQALAMRQYQQEHAGDK